MHAADPLSESTRPPIINPQLLIHGQSTSMDQSQLVHPTNILSLSPRQELPLFKTGRSDGLHSGSFRNPQVPRSMEHIHMNSQRPQYPISSFAVPTYHKKRRASEDKADLSASPTKRLKNCIRPQKSDLAPYAIGSTTAPPRVCSHSAPKVKSQKSPLLQLPGEIRNRVYRYALLEPTSISMQFLEHPPLARTCLQLHREALPIFFAENTFSIALSASAEGYYSAQARTENICITWQPEINDDTKFTSFEFAIARELGTPAICFCLQLTQEAPGFVVTKEGLCCWLSKCNQSGAPDCGNEVLNERLIRATSQRLEGLTTAPRHEQGMTWKDARWFMTLLNSMGYLYATLR